MTSRKTSNIFICIPVFNRIQYTLKCIQSIKKQSFPNYTIIVCDDGSKDNTSQILSDKFPEVVVLPGNGNLWWAGGTNKCIEYALEKAGTDDYIFTLNNDTELADNTIYTLLDFCNDYSGIVSCGNYFNIDKYKLEATAFVQRNKWPFSLYHKLLFPWGQDVRKLDKTIFEVNSVSGKGVLIPVEVFRKIGLFDSKHLPQYHGDSEFSRRASEAGIKIYINLNAVIYTDQTASGIGQVNSKVSLREFITSFFSLRSENHLKSLYYRSKLIYKRKWTIYLAANILSIIIRFLFRYIKAFKYRLRIVKHK
jgi:GT2 family glycosyltransferase